MAHAAAVPKYNADLKAPIEEVVGNAPKAKVHRVEWAKIQNAEPVEINPSVGQGFRVMTVDEWAARCAQQQCRFVVHQCCTYRQFCVTKLLLRLR